jgi:uncharacterized membrane protein
MLLHLYNLFIISIIMACVDVMYLFTMTPFFNKLVKNIQGTEISIKYISAFIVYIFLVLQLYYFVLNNINSYSYNTLHNIIFNSFILGVTTYGVYEYTNHAIFDKWTLQATLYDTLWGGILFSLTSIIYFYIK